MDKYDYVITKPEMEEVLYHAGFHKYIDKYLGKNGKWIYKYAGQAKNAATGAINKAKTMLPGLQKQATGAVSTVKKKASSMASSGSRTASAVKKQAQKRINTMLPILSKKFNSAKKKAKGAYYKQKSKVAERETREVRRKLRILDPKTITEGAKKKRYPNFTKYSVKSTRKGDSGKANSRSGQTGSKVTKTTKVNNRKNSNLRDRGYSSAEGELQGIATILTNTKNGGAVRKVNIYKNHGTKAASNRRRLKPRTKRLKNGAKLTML